MLDEPKLAEALKDAMQAAKEEGWGLEKVAAAFARAIHAYVSDAEVSGVETDVLVGGARGTGRQNNEVRVK